MNKKTSLYVTWRRHRMYEGDGRDPYRLIAQLVSSVVGKEEDEPKVLADLGAIDEKYLNIRIPRTRVFHQGLFWVKVDQVLGTLGLEAGVQQALKDQIKEKVPRPPNDWALWGVTCIPQIDK